MSLKFNFNRALLSVAAMALLKVASSNDTLESPDVRLKKLKDQLSNEFSNLLTRGLLGLSLTALISFLVIEIMLSYKDFLDRFENSLQLEIVTFTALLLIAIMLFAYLFKPKSPIQTLEKLPELKENEPILPLDLQNMAVMFSIGFITGFANRQNSLRTHKLLVNSSAKSGNL